jgi:hypothetical protein
MQVALVYCDVVDLEIEGDEMRKVDPRTASCTLLPFLLGNGFSKVGVRLFNVDLANSNEQQCCSHPMS